MSKEEVQRILATITGTAQLMARLLYGTGMRLMECLRLRVKDIDFANNYVHSRPSSAVTFSD
jgi:integrase